MRTALLLSIALLAPAARAQTAPPGAPAAPVPPPPIESVSFDQAIERATSRAPASEIAVQEVRRVEALLAEVRSGSLPLVAANWAYTVLDHSRTTETQAGPVRTVPAQQRNENVAVSMPLFAPSRWYQWAHAGDQVAVARASQRDTRRLVALTAARAYLTIISQKRAIEVSRRAVDTAAAHFDYSRTRRQGGIGNALDEARAEQQLATSQAQLEGAEAGLERAQEALGIAVGANAPLDAQAEPDLTGGPATPDEGVRLAQEGRTDVLLARERASAAHRVVRDSWADWLPTLSVNAQAFLQVPSTSTTPPNGWQAQLLLNFPLFEGGLRMGQLKERSALAAEARIQLDGTLQQAGSDVRVAYANLQHNGVALEKSRLAADRAHTALTIVEQAFQAGATTSLDVTDAERTARDADSAAVVAEDAVRQSHLDLLAAVGSFP